MDSSDDEYDFFGYRHAHGYFADSDDDYVPFDGFLQNEYFFDYFDYDSDEYLFGDSDGEREDMTLDVTEMDAFPDYFDEEKIEDLNTCIEDLDLGDDCDPTSQPVEMLLLLADFLRQIFNKAEARLNLDCSDKLIQSEMEASKEELAKLPTTAYETVFTWCTWLRDSYVDKLQDCLPTKLPAPAWDMIVQDLLADAYSLESLAVLCEGDLAEESVEGKLIGGCAAAAVQLFKLMYWTLFRGRSEYCATRLHHHIRIFDSAMRSYAAFVEKNTDPPLPGVIKSGVAITLPQCPVHRFTIAGQSLATPLSYYTMIHYCDSESTHHVYLLHHPDTTNARLQKFNVPQAYSRIGDPLKGPIVFPSEEFLTCVIYEEKGRRLALYKAKDPLSGPITSMDMDKVVNRLKDGRECDRELKDFLNAHLTVDTDDAGKLRFLLNFTDEQDVPYTAVLLYTMKKQKKKRTSLCLEVVKVVQAATLVSAMKDHYFLQEASHIVLYKDRHQEIARTDSDPSSPWNVRFDVSGARRCLFYRGDEIQIRSFDLVMVRKILLDAVPSDHYHLSLHGDLIFGQNEHSLAIDIPNMEPFILTPENPDPLYLPEYPGYGGVTSVYMGHLTTDGKVEIMSVSLSEGTSVIQNRVFEVYPGGKREVMVEKKRADLEKEEAEARQLVEMLAKEAEQKKNKEELKKARMETNKKVFELHQAKEFTGIMKNWFADRGYGFAATSMPDEKGVMNYVDVFVHISSVGDRRALQIGQMIKFHLKWDEGKPRPKATSVQVVK